MDEHDRDTPATKGDTEDLCADLLADMQAMEGRLSERHEILRSELQHLSDDLKEAMRDVQAVLLKAFYNLAQSVEVRLKDGEVSDFLTKQRMTVIETRQTEIERRLITPPWQ